MSKSLRNSSSVFDFTFAVLWYSTSSRCVFKGTRVADLREQKTTLFSFLPSRGGHKLRAAQPLALPMKGTCPGLLPLPSKRPKIALWHGRRAARSCGRPGYRTAVQMSNGHAHCPCHVLLVSKSMYCNYVKTIRTARSSRGI